MLLICSINIVSAGCDSRSFSSKGLIYSAKYDDNGEIVEFSITAAKDTGPYVKIPNEYLGHPITMIDDSAFLECNNLVAIQIPQNIQQIANNAFTNCVKLTEISVADNNPNYSSQEGVLFDKNKTEILLYPQSKNNDEYQIPSSVIKVGDKAFFNNTFIADISGGENVLQIGSESFSGCTRLSNLVFPNSLSTIKSRAFDSCYNLMRLTIPHSVTTIEENAFDNCYKLIEIFNLSELPIAVKSEKHGKIGYYALNVQSKNNLHSCITQTEDGFIFFNSNDIVYLVGYNGNNKKPDFPEEYNRKPYEIYNCAFLWNNTIETISIPNFVTSIEKFTFSNCSSLKKIEIPTSITVIDSFAISDCKQLNDITFKGTKEQWDTISKRYNWDNETKFNIHYNNSNAVK